MSDGTALTSRLRRRSASCRQCSVLPRCRFFVTRGTSGPQLKPLACRFRERRRIRHRSDIAARIPTRERGTYTSSVTSGRAGFGVGGVDGRFVS